MNLRLLYCIIFFISANKCYAQRSVFAPGNKIIFEDDFNSDEVGRFPYKWHQKNNNNVSEINDDNGELVFKYIDGFGDFAEPIITTLVKSKNYITFECDFRLVDTMQGILWIIFFSDSFTYARYISIDFHWLSEGWKYKIDPPRYTDKSGTPYGSFLYPIHGAFYSRYDPTLWHHVAICFMKIDGKIYLDGNYLPFLEYVNWGLDKEKLGRIGFIPKSFALGGHAPYEVKNVRFAESDHVPIMKPAESANFNKIITDKKFVTHAIHFDVNKCTIKTESITFIRDIAAWLTQNLIVKLEIDGHTDNDGDAKANMKLSQDRADEIKKQLVLLGVAASRLTTKGFGATKPLQTNATPEGKAENRRVEFIRK